ncbi:MAG: hypothetical protein ACM31C_01685 [Acidobacteriota bacterium]
MNRTLFALLLLAACGSSSSSKPDAKVYEDSAGCMGGSACGQPCYVGNNLGVGKYCTKAGGECSSNPSPFLFCTIDYDSTATPFCTGSCGSDADCGSDAYCDSNGGSGPKGCVTAACGGTPM